MSPLRLRRRLLLLALLGASVLSAQTVPAPAPAPAELTLEDCVRRALSRNFDLEAQRFGPQIAQDGIDVARSNYQPVLSLSTSRSGTHQDATSSAPAIGSRSSSTKLAVTQELYTGTTLGLSSQLDRSRVDPATSALNPAYDADVTVSVRQQLLRGFGTSVNRAAVNRARFGLDKANLDYQVVALDVIQSTENAFFTLVYAREQLEVRRFSLALAQRLSEDSRTRLTNGVATELDVLSADVGVANSRRNLLLAEKEVKDSEQSLLALIGQFELESALGPTRLHEIEDALPVFASSYHLARQSQPDFLSAQAAVEQAKLDLLVAKDSAKPSLSLGGAVGLNGRRGNAGSAYDDALADTNHAWQVDLAFTYPWKQLGDKARYRQSLAALSQSQSRLRKLEQSIELQVRGAVRAVETNSESVKISTLARELSARQYELEKAKFDAGLSTSYRVLQAQDDLENARVAELQAQVSLRTAFAALHRLEGSSLRRYGAALP